MKKKFVSSLLAMVMCLVCCIPAFATTSEQWLVRYDNEGKVYLENSQTGNVMTYAFRIDEHGNQVEVNLVEHAQELNRTPVLPNATYANLAAIQSAGVSYTYSADHHYQWLENPTKVTSDVKGPASITYGESATISESFGGDIGISANIKGIITANAGFNWQKSLSSSAQFTVGFNVPAGKTGYVQFTPKYNVTVGTLTEFDNGTRTTYDVWGMSPIKLSTGFCDGVYELILKN